MAKTIEQRVVEFKFNNSDFEKNVSQSMGTLDNLEKKIKNSTSGDAFKELGKTANGLEFGGLTSTITKVTEKFSVMEQIAIGALRNIGASIEEHLVSGLKKVTTDNILAGFQRYGQKTESVATIMAAIATEDYGDIDKLDYVEELLEKLAWFSDETSYNFTDMTDNISKFTAAGLDLDASTTAMMGIANWAANAGQNAQVASRAMYQLSQAMGMGSIQLIDWKSIEIANMATKEVKELMLEYGVLLGELEKFDEENYVVAGELQNTLKTLREGGDISEGLINASNFRQHLTEEKWLTTDVFSAAMAEYASYSEALHAIINDAANDDLDLYATDLMKKINKALKKAEKTGLSLDDILMEDYGITTTFTGDNGELQSYLSDVTELGIRAMESAQKARTFEQAMDSIQDAASTKWSFVFEKIFGNMEEATELWTYLSEVLYNVFAEPLNGLNDLLNVWKKFGGRDSLFGYEDEDGEFVNGAFHNIVEAIVGDGEEVLGYLDGIKAGLSSVFNPEGLDGDELGEALSEASARFLEWSESLIPTEQKLEKVKQAVINLVSPIKSLSGVVGSVFGSVKTFVTGFGSVFSKVFDYTKVDTSKILESLKNRKIELDFDADAGDIESVLEPIKLMESPIETISKLFTNLGNIVSRFFGALKPSEGALLKLKKSLEGVKVVVDLLFAPIRALNNKLESLLDPDSTKIEKFAGFIGGPLLEAFLWLPSKIGEGIVAINKFAKKFDLFDKIKNVISSSWEAIKGFFSGIAKAANLDFSWINKIKESISDLFNISKKVESSSMFESMSGKLDSIKNWLSETDFSKSGEEIFSTVSESIKKFGESVKSITGIDFDKLGKSISNFADTVWSSLKKIGEGIKESFSGGKIGALSSLGETLSGIFVGEKSPFAGLNLSKVFPEGYFGRIKDIVGQAGDIIKVEKLNFDSPVGQIKEKSEAVESLSIGLDEFASALSDIGSSGEAVSRAMDQASTIVAINDGASEAITESGESSSIVLKAISGLARIFSLLGTAFTYVFNIASSIIDFIGEGLVFMFNKLAGAFNKEEATTVGDVIVGVIEFIADTLALALPILSKIVGVVTQITGGGIDIAVDAISWVIEKIGNIKDSGTFTGIIDFIKSVFKGILDGANEFAESDTVKSIIEKIVSVITYVVDNFLVLAPKLALLMGAKGFMGIGDGMSKFGTAAKRFGTGFKWFADGFIDIGKAAKKYGKAAEINAIGSLLKSIALAVLGISASFVLLKKNGITEFDQMGPYLAAIGVLIGEIFLGVTALLGFGAKKNSETKMKNNLITEIKEFGTQTAALTAVPFILGAMAALILSISKAMVQLYNGTKGASIKDLAGPLVAIFTILGEVLLGVYGIVKEAKTPKGLKGVKGLLIGIGALVTVAVNAVSKLGAIPIEQMAAGVFAIEIVLGTLVVLIKELEELNGMNTKTAGAIALIIGEIAAIIYIVSDAIKDVMSSVSFNEENGLNSVLAIVAIGIVIGGIIYSVGLLFDKLSKVKIEPKKLLTIAGTFLIMGIAISIILNSVSDLLSVANGSESQEIVTRSGDFDIKKASAGGGGGIVGAMIAICAGLYVMGEVLSKLADKAAGWDLIKAAGAMVVMAYAIKIVAGAISGFTQLAMEDPGALALGVIAFAAAVLVMVLAAKSVSDTAIGDGFLKFAGAMLLFGLAIMAIVKAVDMFIDLLIKLGTAVSENKVVILSGLLGLVEVFTLAIPTIAMAVVSLIVAVITTLAQSASLIVDAIIDTLLVILTAISKNIVKILTVLGDILIDVFTFICGFIEANFDLIVNTIVNLLLVLVKAINRFIEEYGEDIVKLVKNLLTVVFKALGDFLLETGFPLLEKLLLDLIERVFNILETTLDRIVDFVKKLIKKVVEVAKDIITAIFDILTEIVDKIVEFADKVKTAALDLIQKFVDGIIEGTDIVLTGIHDLIVGEDGHGGIIGQIEKLATDIIAAGTDLIANVATGIGQGLEKIIKAISDVILGKEGQPESGLIPKLCSFAKQMGEGAGKLVDALVEGILAGVDKVKKAFVKLFEGYENEEGIHVDGILDGIGDMLGSVLSAIARLIRSLATAIRTGVPEISSACADLADAIISSIPLIGDAYELGKKAARSLVDGIYDVIDWEDTKGAAERAANSPLEKLMTRILGEDAYDNAAVAAQDLAGTVGWDVIDGLVKAIEDGDPNVDKAIELVSKGMITEVRSLLGINSPSKVFYKIGTFAIEGLVNGIDDYSDEPKKSVKSVLSRILNELRGSGVYIENEGKTITNELALGILSNTSNIDRAATNLTNRIKDLFKENNYESCGLNVVSGIGKGIEENTSLVERKTKDLAENVKKTIDRVLEINSPSRVMIETGRFIDLGLARGIDKYAKTPIETSEDMGNLLTLAIINAMQMANAALEDENYSPVVSPVIDLSEIQNGMREMDGILYGNSVYSVDAAMRSRYDPYENYDGSLKNNPNSDLLYSVNNVTSKLDEMIAKVDKLKIYLDSGQLVGGIVDKMDNALGRKMVYAGRGNI